MFVNRSTILLSLISLYLLFAIFHQQHLVQILTGESEQVTFYGMIAVGLVLIFEWFRHIEITPLLWLYCFLFFLLLISSLVIHQGHFFGAYFSILMSLALCSILSKRYTKNVWVLLLPPVIYMLFILYRLLFVSLNPGLVFLNSQNWISFYGILLIIPYYYVGFSNKLRVLAWPAALLFLLSVYSHSRSGIASSAIMFYSVLLYSGLKTRHYMLLALLLGVAGLVFSINIFDSQLVRFDNLHNLLREGGREGIIYGIFTSLDWYNYLFGFAISDVKSTYEISTNIHSSYLNIMITSGIGGMTIVILLLMASFLILLRTYSAMGLLLLSAVLRVATDSGALYGFFDASVVLIIYYAFHVRKNSGKISWVARDSRGEFAR